MAFNDLKNKKLPRTLIEHVANSVERTRNERSEAIRNSDMMTRKILPAGPIRRGGIGFNRKMDGKGSEYRPGVEVPVEGPVEVPAIEESLLNLDEELV